MPELVDCWTHQLIRLDLNKFNYVCGNPQPRAIGHTQTRLQPESGAGELCTVCSLVNWEMTHS